MVERCGYVALVGRPNTGKSTLLNHILRQKISITSRKPQTTRHLLLGIDTEGEHQAIYVDTPGIHDHAARALNRQMVRSAMAAIQDVDLVLMVVDRDQWTDQDQLVLDAVKAAGRPCFLIINKVDLLSRYDDVLPIIAAVKDRHPFTEIVPISALKSRGVEGLRQAVFAQLPETSHLFPPEQVTDQSERFLVAEIVREKLMRQLGDELPHRTAVVVESFKTDGPTVDIAANIVVERSGQKRILIGKGGERIRAVGQAARLDIEALLERKVMLRLWVKVKSGWSNDPAMMQQLGYGKDQ